MIRPITPQDSPKIATIYNHYIENTPISFEETPVSPEEIEKRIHTITSQYLWLVFEENNEILGYAYAAKFKERSAYRYSVEMTVYLHPHSVKKGLGTLLYTTLIDALKTRGFHRAYGIITLPNEPSVRLHEKCGFKKVAHLSSAGFKFNRWIDVGYWELSLK